MQVDTIIYNINKYNNIINIEYPLMINYKKLKDLYIENKEKINTTFYLIVKKDLETITINLKENTTHNILIIVNKNSNLKININLDKYTKANFNLIQYATNSNVNVFVNNNGMYSECFSNSLVVSNKRNLNILNFNTKNNNKNTIVDTKAYGVASNNSKVVLNYIGKIENGMSGSSCYEELKGINRNKAKIEVNPILEIDEFDISAGHGASCGNISQDILFYMQSRGLNQEMAENLYLLGFITPFFEQIGAHSIYENLKEEVLKKL